MKNIVIFIVFFLLVGCKSTAPNLDLAVEAKLVNESTLSLDDSVEVIQAVVVNPYPECQEDNKVKVRLANLSQKRSKRVYIEGGVLCQRTDY